MSQPQPPYTEQPATSSRRWWVRYAVGTVVAAAAALAIGGWVSTQRHDSGSTTNPAACKAAMAANYRKAVANGGKGPTAIEPTACVGLDQETLQRLTGEVIKEYLDSDQAKKDVDKALEGSMASVTPTPSVSVSASPKCRAWIRKELQDSSDGVDGHAGYAVCGDLSDDELQAAIDQVTRELEAR